MDTLLNKDRPKRQRGSNYTAREQIILLELIKKHIEIIDNKETTAVMCSKKREAWDAITRRYNAMAVTGSRDWMQLRYLYDNLKQKRKRKKLRESMKSSPDKIKSKMEKLKNAAILSFSLDQLNGETPTGKKDKISAEEGAFSSKLAEIGQQAQELTSQKMDPLQFGIELTVSGKRACDECDDMETITVPAEPLFVVKQEIEEESISASSSNKEFPDDVSERKESDNEKSCSSAKEEYYKQKLKNIKLERKCLLERHRMEKEKISLELEILKLQRQKLL